MKRLVHVQTCESKVTSTDKRTARPTNIKHDRENTQFDYAIVPTYLPTIDINDHQEQLTCFQHVCKHTIVIRYQSLSLPLGLFHRLSVSAILRLNIYFTKHWNNFILGQHEDKDVQ
jgi:hypothetical protein